MRCLVVISTDTEKGEREVKTERGERQTDEDRGRVCLHKTEAQTQKQREREREDA